MKLTYFIVTCVNEKVTKGSVIGHTAVLVWWPAQTDGHRDILASAGRLHAKANLASVSALDQLYQVERVSAKAWHAIAVDDCQVRQFATKLFRRSLDIHE